MLSHDFTVWAVRRRKRTKPYQVRWIVAKGQHSRSFLSSALAEDFRADLLKAARRGELFDTESGLPESVLDAADAMSDTPLLWLDFVSKYVAARWAGAAAKSRESIVRSPRRPREWLTQFGRRFRHGRFKGCGCRHVENAAAASSLNQD